jgi:hypothetical protein
MLLMFLMFLMFLTRIHTQKLRSMVVRDEIGRSDG